MSNHEQFSWIYQFILIILSLEKLDDIKHKLLIYSTILQKYTNQTTIVDYYGVLWEAYFPIPVTYLLVQ